MNLNGVLGFLFALVLVFAAVWLFLELAERF